MIGINRFNFDVHVLEDTHSPAVTSANLNRSFNTMV
jgi:hypothetical protein